DLAVYDTVASAAARFKSERCRVAPTPQEAARDCEVVITMLPSSREARDTMLGATGAAAVMAPGTLFIDMSTGSASDSMELNRELAARGIRMLDAPVGRTPEDATRGTLMVIVGGRDEDVSLARPLFEAMADTIHHMGPAGSGIRTKLVN